MSLLTPLPYAHVCPQKKMLPFDSQVLTLLNIKHIPQNLFIF
ncbi:hypothetical protein HID58_094451 [Brassica napus]|uniref:Uncharacterized protein n=1 Tax=Brassica napus TaxID=3708 RepID=A0ABQ7X750_BRANA|nr:hypothetical protein HID58_094451 [Brassica napus]